MMTIGRCLLIIEILIILVACNNNESFPSTVHIKDRTVLVYMAADNSLSKFAQDDLNEMIQGIVSVDLSKNNLLIYIDDEPTSREGARLIKLSRNNNDQLISNVIEYYGTRNSVGVSEMKEVLNRAFKGYPANSYGLVLWSHGEGWLRLDEPNSRWWGQDNGEYMNITNLHQVLSLTTPKLEFILFDACFMQTIEIAYELKDCAKYIIGSPAEIPGPGAPYAEIIPQMFSSVNPAKLTAQKYYEYYEKKYNGNIFPSNNNWTAGVAISVVNTSHLNVLAEKTREIIENFVESRSYIDLSQIQCYDPLRSPNVYFDLVGIMEYIAGDSPEYYSWKQIYESTVPYYKSTTKIYSMLNGGGMISMENFMGISTNYTSSHNMDTRKWYEFIGWDNIPH